MCSDLYTAAGDGCVLKSDEDLLELVIPGGDLEGARSLTFRSRVDADGTFESTQANWKAEAGEINSQVLGDYFVRSALGCWKYKNPEMCQALANLCVLTLYDQTSKPCLFLAGKEIAASAEGAPWVLYEETAEELLIPLGEIEPDKFEVTAKFRSAAVDQDASTDMAF